MASLGSASAFRTYGQGHGEPRFEGDRRHSPFGARAHDAFGYPGTGDVGWGGPCCPREGFPAALCLGTARHPPRTEWGGWRETWLPHGSLDSPASARPSPFVPLTIPRNPTVPAVPRPSVPPAPTSSDLSELPGAPRPLHIAPAPFQTFLPVLMSSAPSYPQCPLLPVPDFPVYPQ